MNKIISLLAFFCAAFLSSPGQTSSVRMLFVIDSIPVLFDLNPLNDLWEEDIASRIAVRNDQCLQIKGAAEIDSITYIFTKEYVNRPTVIQQLPSLKHMERKDSAWHLHGIPYTGKYVDYYYSGKKFKEGSLLDGKEDGEEIYYFQNGQVAKISHYKNGKPEGFGVTYYKNGRIQTEGRYSENLNWRGISYFPNGLVESRSTEINATGIDSVIYYFSTGKIKHIVNFKDGKIVMDSAFRRFVAINKKLDEIKLAATRKAAKKMAAAVTALDSVNADVYGRLGLFMLDKNYFNEAIAAFDKALEMEPYLIQVLVYRAIARIKKNGPERRWVKVKNSDSFILTPFDIKSVPAAEREKICDDLERADAMRTIYGYSFDFLLVENAKKYCGLSINH